MKVGKQIPKRRSDYEMGSTLQNILLIRVLDNQTESERFLRNWFTQLWRLTSPQDLQSESWKLKRTNGAVPV